MSSAAPLPTPAQLRSFLMASTSLPETAGLGNTVTAPAVSTCAVGPSQPQYYVVGIVILAVALLCYVGYRLWLRFWLPSEQQQLQSASESQPLQPTTQITQTTQTTHPNHPNHPNSSQPLTPAARQPQQQPLPDGMTVKEIRAMVAAEAAAAAAPPTAKANRKIGG